MSDDDSDEYEVEAIIGEKADRKGNILYKVKWLGYSVDEASWVPKKDMHCPAILKKWNSRETQRTPSNQSRKRRRSSVTTATKKSTPKAQQTRNSSRTRRSPSPSADESIPKKETSSRSAIRSPSLSQSSRTKARRLQSPSPSGEKRSTTGSLSKKGISDVTTQNDENDDGEEVYSQLLEKYAALKSQHLAERAKRIAAEEEVKKRKDLYEKLKKELAQMKLNQQFISHRSSAGVASSSGSEIESSDESDSSGSAN